MNWNHISGFFDADGSVTLCKSNSNKSKTLQLSFHNNEKSILEEIQNFIRIETGYKGSISIKKAKKENHNDSYDLKYVYKAALIIANKIDSIHVKKKHRIRIYNEIQNVTPRNGKYSEQLREQRNALETEFWRH